VDCWNVRVVCWMSLLRLLILYVLLILPLFIIVFISIFFYIDLLYVLILYIDYLDTSSIFDVVVCYVCFA